MLDEFVACHCRVQLWRFIWVRARTMLSRRFRGSSPSLAVKYSSRLVHSSLSPHLPNTVSISSRIFTGKRKCCEIERRTAASSNAHNRSRHTLTRRRRQATSPSSKHRRRHAKQTITSLWLIRHNEYRQFNKSICPSFWLMCVVTKRSPISASAELLFSLSCSFAIGLILSGVTYHSTPSLISLLSITCTSGVLQWRNWLINCY